MFSKSTGIPELLPGFAVLWYTLVVLTLSRKPDPHPQMEVPESREETLEFYDTFLRLNALRISIATFLREHWLTWKTQRQLDPRALIPCQLN